jgi:hypothetical protein
VDDIVRVSRVQAVVAVLIGRRSVTMRLYLVKPL